MLIVHPDFARRIDLPGAGPCPRPVDIDRSLTGFSKLISLRVYSFARELVIDGEAEDDELFIVVMSGEAEIVVHKGSHEAGRYALRPEGGSRAVYMPPHASYKLTAVTDCDIAYARAEPLGTKLPDVRGFALAAGRLDIVGHATGMDLALATVGAGQDAGIDDDARPERLVHLRADGATTATIAGEPLGDWDSIALDDGDGDVVKVGTGAAVVLTVSASKDGKAVSDVANGGS